MKTIVKVATTEKTAILKIWLDDTVVHITGLTEKRVRLFDLTADGIGSFPVVESMRQIAQTELVSQGYTIIEEIY